MDARATVEPIDVTEFFTQSKYPVSTSRRLSRSPAKTVRESERRRKKNPTVHRLPPFFCVLFSQNSRVKSGIY